MAYNGLAAVAAFFGLVVLGILYEGLKVVRENLLVREARRFTGANGNATAHLGASYQPRVGSGDDGAVTTAMVPHHEDERR